ncbi:gb [Venturia nashicola]|uniref:Gb n=1 Tax=Venturia nashicola TaxID=86259 RepID=A0A4Z1PF10_9PEZI|nr:gb [Venturia nashicola]TLD36439.1 gb [Venturia nashicola]
MTTTNLLDLPNELILHVFALFPTSTLLSISPVSHRFHDLVLRLLQLRLLQAAELSDHTLLLECHHPSQKFTAAPLNCPYLGTPMLDRKEKEIDSSIGNLSVLRSIYSSYQPRRRKAESPARKRPGDIPGSRTHQESSPLAESSSPTPASRLSNGPILEPDPVKQIISLEDHELFSQLCATVNLVRNGGQGKGVSNDIHESIAEDESILWFDLYKHVGLRVIVRESKWAGDPLMLLNNEDEVVNYEVEYKEMIVRTSHLLLFMEQSLRQQDNSTGKAVVFGSWDT